MAPEMPTLNNFSYTTTTNTTADPPWGQAMVAQRFGERDASANFVDLLNEQQQAHQPKKARKARRIEKERNMTDRRLVQVFVADPNENIPLDDCLLYKGEIKLTDSTDQELFYEIGIIEILTKHNEKRVTILDKDLMRQHGQEVHLEAARISDLSMTVVTIAEF